METRPIMPYPQYKPSGIEWVGEIPEHWETSKLKWFSKVQTGKTPPSETLEYYANPEVDWYTPSDFNDHFVLGDSSRKISQKAIEQGVINLFPKKSVLLVGIGATLGKVGITDRPACSNQQINAIIFDRNLIWPEFEAYFLKSISKAIVSLSNASTLAILNQTNTKDLNLLIPPYSEQRQIARFLTHKTQQIDTTIAKLQRLIELLGEERAALINEVVTKGLRGEAAKAVGLDPDPPMKDSGVEWIGEAPGHWEVVKLKYITPGVTVGIVVTPSKYYEKSGVACLRSFNVKEMNISMDDLAFISNESNEELRKSKIFEGDIVSIRTGKAGTTAVVPQTLDGCNCIDLIIIRKSEHFNSFYIAYLLNSNFAKKQFGSGSTGAIQQHFNIETASNMLIMYPPLREQNAIVSHIIEKTGIIDTEIKSINQEIELLQEYRQSLISEAVTGKIDVREYPLD